MTERYIPMSSRPGGVPKPPRRKALGYRSAIEVIALNDEPSERDIDEMVGYASVVVVSAIYHRTQERMAADLVRYRERNDV